jgi:hypothetical protein
VLAVKLLITSRLTNVGRSVGTFDQGIEDQNRLNNEVQEIRIELLRHQAPIGATGTIRDRGNGGEDGIRTHDTGFPV